MFPATLRPCRRPSSSPWYTSLLVCYVLCVSFKELPNHVFPDYVFDGTSPPYIPSSLTNPLQLYGKSKRDGEIAVLSVNEAKVIVFRVPVLYVSTPGFSLLYNETMSTDTGQLPKTLTLLLTFYSTLFKISQAKLIRWTTMQHVTQQT